MAHFCSETDRLYFAYRLRYSSRRDFRFNIRALGIGDGDSDRHGTVLSTGQTIEWYHPIEIASTAESWEEREQGRLRDLALGFSMCELDVHVPGDEFLISQSKFHTTQFIYPVTGMFQATSIVHLAPLQHCLLWERIDAELRAQRKSWRSELLDPTVESELMTSDRLIRVAESLEILAGDYLTVSIGANGPAACLAIRAILPERKFEGELFAANEIPRGEHEIYSDESGKINGICTRIAARIGHMEIRDR